MIIDLLIGLFAAFGIFCLMQSLKKAILSPVPKAENIKLSTVIAVHGPAPELETVVKALRWQMESGRPIGEIVLLDRGMDSDTAFVAEKLAFENDLKIIF